MQNKRNENKVLILSSTYNHFHNILRLFDALPNFRFTTSETVDDYYLCTWYIRVASRVAERLKTYDLRKLGNIRKVSKLDIITAQCPFLPPKWKNLYTSKKTFKFTMQTFPVVRYFAWILALVSNILWIIVQWDLQTNLQLPVAFVTGKETFLHRAKTNKKQKRNMLK